MLKKKKVTWFVELAESVKGPACKTFNIQKRQSQEKLETKSLNKALETMPRQGTTGALNRALKQQ